MTDIAIQPHGFLLSCTLPDWTVRQVSANVVELLDLSPEDVIGRSLREHVADEVLQPLREVIEQLEPDASPQRAAVGNIGVLAHLCDISVHVSAGLVHLELEPRSDLPSDEAPTVVAQRMIARVGEAGDMRGLHQRSAEEIRELTGHDAVFVVRFDDGEVIAETGDADFLASLRGAASDFLLPLHAPCARNRVHVIPDTRAQAVPILPGRDSSGVPLDLTLHALRCAPTIQVARLASMGVASSLSVSIANGGQPWGLIACYHREPRRVPPAVRAVADLFGLFASMRVEAAEQAISMHALEAELQQLTAETPAG